MSLSPILPMAVKPNLNKPIPDPILENGPAVGLLDKDFYDPLLRNQGIALLKDAIQQYIQSKSGDRQKKLYTWIHQMLSLGLNPNPNPQANFEILTPLLHAKKGKLLALLKEYGSEIPTPEQIKAAEWVLIHAVQSPDPDHPDRTARVKKALATPGVRVNLPAFVHRTPLVWIAMHGHAELLDIFLGAGADPNLPGKGFETPLGWAAERGHLSIVNALLKAGADIEIHDQYRKTPLSWAASQGQTEIVRALLAKNARLETTDQYNHTPLHYAQVGGHGEIARMIKAYQKRKQAPTSSRFAY